MCARQKGNHGPGVSSGDRETGDKNRDLTDNIFWPSERHACFVKKV